MSIEPFVLPAVIVGAISSGASLLAIVAGAFMYDMRETSRQRQIKRHPHARANRQRPLITVAISTRNNEDTIEHCLESIFQNNYRNVEVLVVDHASRDRTAQLVRSHMAAYPKRRIRLVRRKKSSGMPEAGFYAIKHGRGQLVVMLAGSFAMDGTALLNLARRFEAKPELDACSFNENLDSRYSITNLFAVYRYLLGSRAEKTRSITGMGNNLGEAACFRKQALLKPAALHKIIYAHDVIVSAQTPAKLRRPVAFGWINHLGKSEKIPSRPAWLAAVAALNELTSLLLQPLLITYFLYLALVLHEPVLLLLLLGLLSTSLLFAIWGSDQVRTSRKAALALGIPLTFGLFYALTLLRLFAAISKPAARLFMYTRSLHRAG